MMNSKGRLAIMQVILLVVGIFAISWMIGGEIGIVGANKQICNGLGGEYLDTTQVCSEEIVVANLEPGKICCKIAGEVEEKGKLGGKEILTDAAGGGAAYLVKEGAKKVLNKGGAAKEVTSKAGEEATKKAAEEATKNAGEEATKFFSKKGPGALTKLFSGSSETWWASSAGPGILATAVWSAAAFLVGRYLIGPQLGLNVEQSQAVGKTLGAGTAFGVGAYNILGASVGLSLGVGVVVAAIVFVSSYRKESQDLVAFSCFSWSPEDGGKKCEECNGQDLPCTEYQCRSLGKDCVLTEGEEGEQLCVAENPDDIKYPIIEPWDEALNFNTDNYRYAPDNQISPPDRGVYVSYEGSKDTTRHDDNSGVNCVPAFTPFTFGIELNEPAKCKINRLRVSSYEDMADIYFSNGGIKYNHSYTLALPPSDYNNITLENGGNFELYVRCSDNNGNANEANFVFKYCVDETPDTTAPEIVSTSIADGSPISAGTLDLPVDVYVRDNSFVTENSGCKWSRLDKTYEDMENNLTCSHNLVAQNLQLYYRCSAELTGLQDREQENFYFRCVDDNGYANTQSYQLSLVGTEDIVIDSVKPNNTIITNRTNKISVDLEVETSAGYDEGRAICAFSTTGQEGSFIDFFYGYDTEPYSQYEHVQSLDLIEGDYEFYIRCRDKGGNIDEEKVNFKVETDLEPPVVVRAFKELDSLKIITSEPGVCVYDDKSCSSKLEDGNDFEEDYSLSEGIGHLAEWDKDKNYYVKCSDKLGNWPDPDACSIIVRPFEIYDPQAPIDV